MRPGKAEVQAEITALRRCSQVFVALLCLWAGYRLYVFVGQCLRGIPAGFCPDPAVVDGFLPIGGLMGLKLWLTTGILDPAHPAAIVILLAAILVSVLFKKGFCGWICPVGTLSEALWKTGEKMSGGRVFSINRRADYCLRSVKYILFAFFASTVFLMPSWTLGMFMGSSYWATADARMLFFFEHLSATAAVVLAGLFIGSLFYRNFWCRYFCPYGALLGLLGLLSPAKIIRDDRSCAHCGACRRNCPASIPVDEKEAVRTPECNGCLACVAGCPAPGALAAGFGKIKNRAGAPFLYAALLLAVFFGVIALAMASGHWAPHVPPSAYRGLTAKARGR